MKRRGTAAAAWALAAATTAMAAAVPEMEEYFALKEANGARARKEERQFGESLRAIQTDRDLSIYRKFLELRKKAHMDRENKMLEFTGEVTQKLDLAGWTKSLVLLVGRGKDELAVTARFGGVAGFGETIPDWVKAGSIVTVRGVFAGGNSRRVELKLATLEDGRHPENGAANDGRAP